MPVVKAALKWAKHGTQAHPILYPMGGRLDHQYRVDFVRSGQGLTPEQTRRHPTF